MSRSNLPKCMYKKHGAYYLVKNNKWIGLGRDYARAMAEYGILTTPRHAGSSVGLLLQETIDEAEERLADNTIKQYRLCEKKISQAFAEFRPDEVKPTHIAQFIDHHSKTPNLANRMLSLLRMSFNRGVLFGLCDINPATSIPRLKEKKRDRLMTDEEYSRIWGYDSEVLKSVMDLCYSTAQRISDVLSIKMSDIDKGGITFKQQKTGKKLKVEMTDLMLDAIKRARSLHPKRVTPIYLLGQRSGKKRSYGGVKDLFNRGKEQANVTGVTLHDIRAKSLTDAKKQGINATALAGHTTEAQTTRYIRDKETDIVVGVDRFIR